MILNHCRLVAELTENIASEDGAVAIENGIITQIWDTPQEAGFDCKKKTLLPGLLDIHTHVTGLTDLDYTSVDAVAKQAAQYLEYGFTTIRDCGSMDRIVHEVRDAINRGRQIGPDILSCGRILTPTETSSRDSLMPMYSEADGPYEMRKVARRELAEKADFIKVMASGSAFHPQGVPKHPIMMEDELREITAVAAMKGTYVAAHAHADSAIEECIRLGVRTIEHATYLSEETLELLLKTKDCFLVPTLAAMYVSVSDPDGFWEKRLGQMLDACAENIRRAYLAGCKLGFGTDSTAGMQQYEKGIEFRYRKEKCGMKAIDILLQATVYSAQIAGVSDRVGSIGIGKQADLVLVDGKPDLDISCMYHKPEHVWKRGTLIR